MLRTSYAEVGVADAGRTAASILTGGRQTVATAEDAKQHGGRDQDTDTLHIGPHNGLTVSVTLSASWLWSKAFAGKGLF